MSSTSNNNPSENVGGSGQEVGKNYVTVYTCDVCKVAKFDTSKEAEQHEKNCKAGKVPPPPQNNYPLPPPPPQAPLSSSATAPPQNNKPPPQAPLSSLSAAAPPQSTLPSSTSTTTDTITNKTVDENHLPTDGIVNKTLYKCRKCKLLFWTTEKAALHEKSCQDKNWINCNVCMVLRFRSQDEVAVHKQTCRGPMPLRVADLPLAEPLPTRDSIVSGGGLPQSVISGSGTVVAGSSVEQVERAPAKIEQVKRKAEDVINEGQGSVVCPPAKKKKEEQEVIDVDASPSPSSGEMNWATVWTCDICKVKQFSDFNEAVEHERICKGKKATAGEAPPSSESLVTKPKPKPAAPKLAAPKPKAKKVVPPRSTHPEIKYGDQGCTIMVEQDYGKLFRVGPLDGLPFISTFSREAAKKLHPSEKFLLQQLELFTISPELMSSVNMKAPAQAVGLRCRNCIAQKDGCCFMKLNTVSNTPRDVLLMAREHVMRHCKFMKAKDQKIVQELKGEAGAFGKYCNLVTKLYNLKDSKESGDDNITGVVLGESVTVPAGYSKPSSIDVTALMPELVEAEADERKEPSPVAKEVQKPLETAPLPSAPPQDLSTAP